MSASTTSTMEARQQMLASITQDYLEKLQRWIATDPPSTQNGGSVEQCAAFSAVSFILGREMERAGPDAVRVLADAAQFMAEGLLASLAEQAALAGLNPEGCA